MKHYTSASGSSETRFRMASHSALGPGRSLIDDETARHRGARHFLMVVLALFAASAVAIGCVLSMSSTSVEAGSSWWSPAGEHWECYWLEDFDAYGVTVFLKKGGGFAQPFALAECPPVSWVNVAIPAPYVVGPRTNGPVITWPYPTDTTTP